MIGLYNCCLYKSRGLKHSHMGENVTRIGTMRTPALFVWPWSSKGMIQVHIFLGPLLIKCNVADLT
jgi:hypothetical protein